MHRESCCRAGALACISARQGRRIEFDQVRNEPFVKYATAEVKTPLTARSFAIESGNVSSHASASS